MGQFKYITNRTLENKAGEEKGKIRAAVKDGSSIIEGEYVCPECSHLGKINQPFKRPLSVKCAACNFLLRLPRLKK